MVGQSIKLHDTCLKLVGAALQLARHTGKSIASGGPRFGLTAGVRQTRRQQGAGRGGKGWRRCRRSLSAPRKSSQCRSSPLFLSLIGVSSRLLESLAETASLLALECTAWPSCGVGREASVRLRARRSSLRVENREQVVRTAPETSGVVLYTAHSSQGPKLGLRC